MEFKKLANNTINFGINRIIETAGIALVVIGLLLLVSLATFSPDDPNFIFPDNTEIKNLLGFKGSYTADLFFQTFGLIALLIPFTISLDPVAAISMMAALYCAGTFGGSITAILINAPGAPPSVAPSIDLSLLHL